MSIYYFVPSNERILALKHRRIQDIIDITLTFGKRLIRRNIVLFTGVNIYHITVSACGARRIITRDVVTADRFVCRYIEISSIVGCNDLAAVGVNVNAVLALRPPGIKN